MFGQLPNAVHSIPLQMTRNNEAAASESRFHPPPEIPPTESLLLVLGNDPVPLKTLEQQGLQILSGETSPLFTQSLDDRLGII